MKIIDRINVVVSADSKSDVSACAISEIKRCQRRANNSLTVDYITTGGYSGDDIVYAYDGDRKSVVGIYLIYAICL